MKGTGADQIVFLIKDILLRINLRRHDARSQCYYGAASMAGAKTGVVIQIKAISGKCLYTHCYGHALTYRTQEHSPGGTHCDPTQIQRGWLSIECERIYSVNIRLFFLKTIKAMINSLKTF